MPKEEFITDPSALTPIQRRGDLWVKREDLFRFGGVRGSKARAIREFLRGAKGVVTGGARQATMTEIVPQIARAKGIPCRLHIPAGEETKQTQEAKGYGADLIRHSPGYMTVVFARAKADAERLGWHLIPFGLQHEQTVGLAAAQVRRLPPGVKRIVTAVGSGTTLAGILTGLAATERKIPVLGVIIGADPRPVLERYAPEGWRSMVTLRASGHPYAKEVPGDLDGIVLDPVYEAKCLPLLKAGDLFWIVSIRSSAYRAQEESSKSADLWPEDLAP